MKVNRFVALAIVVVLTGQAATVHAGRAYFFGANGSGLTGLGTTITDTWTATPINTSNLEGLAITQVAAGFRHSLLIAVPEPSSLSLGSLAVAGLALPGFARRRK